MILSVGVGIDTLIFQRSLATVAYKEGLKIFNQIPLNGFPLNSARFFEFDRYLDTIKPEKQLILSDGRDVIFQSEPSVEMPSTGLHAYCEDESMTIATCPYNSKWIMEGFGASMLTRIGKMPIICAGIIAGGWTEVRDYIKVLCATLKRLPKVIGLDQGAHNVLLRSDYGATIHDNYDEVYTVGYIKRESLLIETDGFLYHDGKIPCAVHQYDRHKNLKKHFEEKYR